MPETPEHPQGDDDLLTVEQCEAIDYLRRNGVLEDDAEDAPLVVAACDRLTEINFLLKIENASMKALLAKVEHDGHMEGLPYWCCECLDGRDVDGAYDDDGVMTCKGCNGPVRSEAEGMARCLACARDRLLKGASNG